MNNYIAFIITVVALIAGITYARYHRKKKKEELIYKDEHKPIKLQQAFDLVKDEYDFSGVYVIAGHLIVDDIWGQYKSGIIVINDSFLEWAPIEKIACALVHELAHHQGKTEAEAGIIGKDCYKKFKIE